MSKKIGFSENLGRVLAADNGFTLYTFANDADNVSNCVGQCLELWPPFVVDSVDDIVAEGLPGELGSITRDDGSIQVTLNGQPLYYYSQDANPGEVTGQGVGNVWFAVTLDTVLAAKDALLGSYLAANNGFTLYTFNNDGPGISNCVGQCVELWPPLIIEGEVFAPADNIPGELGTITRDDGSKQLTFNERPLYYFGQDAAPGDTNGQGVGGVWFAVQLDTVRVSANADLGSFLVGPTGMTLYVFANDEPGWSNCVEGCIEGWPALAVPAEGAVLAPGQLQDMLATSLRADGTFQVTFNDQPLYYFAGDEARGDTNGNGRGGVWSIVPVDPTLAASGPTCELTPAGNAANLRVSSTTDSEISRAVGAGEVLVADAQTEVSGGFVWYHLVTGEWVRNDVVSGTENCGELPVI